ncbi:MAG: molybdopterin-guanine dinucleotide biosynthesis protein B [Halodesulfurarchaeum sp.]
MRVLAVAGYRNSGKTSLVETLLGAFPADRHVATIKSLHHDVDFDTAGTDTYRHRTAGADTVVGMTPHRTVEFRTAGKADGLSVADRLAELRARDVDWVVVEGFKAAPLPTILVGDIEASAVGGEVLFRVQDGTAVDGEKLLGRIQDVPKWRGSARGDE